MLFVPLIQYFSPPNGSNVTVGSTKQKVDHSVGHDVDSPLPGVHLTVGVLQVVIIVEVELGNQFLKNKKTIVTESVKRIERRKYKSRIPRYSRIHLNKNI